MRSRAATLAGALFPVVLLTAPALADGDAEKGRRLAEQHCSRCHVVAGFNPYGGIGSTPSFQRLAKLDDYDARFETFYARRPHPVFVIVEGQERPSVWPSHVEPFEFEIEWVDDLMAFAEELRAGEE